MASSSKLDATKQAFIEAAIANNALLFGNFELKSGRKSPYFFNAGNLYTGSLLDAASRAFGKIIMESSIPEFDVLFGPAYKGIPLAAAAVIALSRDYGKDMKYAYNRKEKKDHGEGGMMVGAPLKGRIVIIDDVITSGKAVREAIDIIQAAPEAKLVGIVQLVDRQEKGKGGTGKSSIQELQEEYGIPVEAIIVVGDIIRYLEKKGGMDKELEEVREYWKEYGIASS